MKRMTKKLYGILILSMLATSAHAGWLSNLGQRIVNGAANTVQNNISGKVNKTIDDVMDGKAKVGKTSSKENLGTEAQVKTEKGNKVISTKASASDYRKSEYGGKALEEKITVTSERGKTLNFTDQYKEIDFGTFRFQGEVIFRQNLEIGNQIKEVDVFLAPGKYLFSADCDTFNVPIKMISKHIDEGVPFGYGIVPREEISNPGQVLSGKKDGMIYVLEVLQGQVGHLEVALINDLSKQGQGHITIYKIPD